jgi:Flp pilus assembly protein TadD
VIAAPADPTAKPVPNSQAPAAPPVPAGPVIPKAPARANAEFTRALNLMRSDPTQAILEFQVLTQSYPDLPGPYANLGILYRNANQLAEAEAAMAKAAERASWDAQTLSEYGITLRQAGKFPEARTVYEKALAANSSYAPAHRNLGVLLDLYLDDSLQAQTELETYKRLTNEDKPVSGWIAELKGRNKATGKAPASAPPAETAPAETPPAETPPATEPPPATAQPAPQGGASQ